MQTVQSSAEFAQPTQLLQPKGVSTSTPVRNVFTLVQPAAQKRLPLGTTEASTFLQRWANTPERRARIASGRQDVGSILGTAGEVSLRTLRLALGLSQAQVAAQMQTSQSHVARIETGTCDPTLDTLRKLAAVLKTDVNTLNLAIPGNKVR